MNPPEHTPGRIGEKGELLDEIMKQAKTTIIEVAKNYPEVNWLWGDLCMTAWTSLEAGRIEYEIFDQALKVLIDEGVLARDERGRIKLADQPETATAYRIVDIDEHPEVAEAVRHIMSYVSSYHQDMGITWPSVSLFAEFMLGDNVRKNQNFTTLIRAIKWLIMDGQLIEYQDGRIGLPRE